MWQGKRAHRKNLTLQSCPLISTQCCAMYVPPSCIYKKPESWIYSLPVRPYPDFTSRGRGRAPLVSSDHLSLLPLIPQGRHLVLSNNLLCPWALGRLPQLPCLCPESLSLALRLSHQGCEQFCSQQHPLIWDAPQTFLPLVTNTVGFFSYLEGRG